MNHSRRLLIFTRVASATVRRAAIMGAVLVSFYIAHSADYALQFNGGSDGFVVFPTGTLGVDGAFTVECWFKMSGPGPNPGVAVKVGHSLQSGTYERAIPLVTKGFGGIDTLQGNPVSAVNYFLGINYATTTPDNRLFGDFEDTQSNHHPVIGTTTLAYNKWYHAALVYEGVGTGKKLRLYLNGIQETESSALDNKVPYTSSDFRAAIGAACDASGTPGNAWNVTPPAYTPALFIGQIDRVRIWRAVRSAEDILSFMGRDDLREPGEMLGQWSCYEGTDISLHSVSGASSEVTGTLHGNQPGNIAWVAGVPSPEYQGVPTVVAPPACGTVTRGYDFPNAGISHYIDLENAVPANTYSLVQQFTIETWFRREGDGVTVTIGDGWSSSMYQAIPLICKGGADTDEWDPTKDGNYFLGIARNNSGVWVLGGDMESDFSENFPILGSSEIKPYVWYHAALTFDESDTVLRLYLNGNLEASIQTFSAPASATGIQATAGAARNWNNQPVGAFQGKMDDIRIWNVVRDATQIKSDMNGEITPPTSLVGYFKLNELSGDVAVNSRIYTPTKDGTVRHPSGATSQWTAFNRPPYEPTEGTTTGNARSVTLSVKVQDSDNNSGVYVDFYGRAKYANNTFSAYTPYIPPKDFMIVVLPDTQNYVDAVSPGTRDMFSKQIEWIINNRANSNIVYVTQLGDCAQMPNSTEYDVAADNPASSYYGFYDFERGGINLPYGIAVGSHDQSPNGDALASTSDYNAKFGVNHFLNEAPYKGYYGGSYGDFNGTTYTANNDNHYDLISAGGSDKTVDFVIIYLEFNPADDPIAPNPPSSQASARIEALNWADAVLKAYPGRRGIVVSHYLMNANGTFSVQGQKTYEKLKANPNFTLMLCGHECYSARRSDTFNGVTVHTLLSDYECTADGGGGYMRLLEFSPSNNVVRVRTYSPIADKYLEIPQDNFDLPYDLSHTPWVKIGNTKSVNNSQTAQTITSDKWTLLLPGGEYDWYASAFDNCSSTSAPGWTFALNRYGPLHFSYGTENYVESVNDQANPYAVGSLLSSSFEGKLWNSSGSVVRSFPRGSSYTGAFAVGVNNLADVVGFQTGTSDAGFVTLDALNSSVMIDLAAFPSRAYRINNNRIIVGYAQYSSGRRASQWTASGSPPFTPTPLGMLFGDTSSIAYDVNDLNPPDIVGESIDQSGGTRAILHNGSSLIALPFLDRNQRSTARGVNNGGSNRGVIVGWQENPSQSLVRAVRWTPVQLTPPAFQPAELAPPPGSPPGSASYAYKINNAGLIVGSVISSQYGERAVVWKDGTGFYLDALNDPVFGHLPLIRAVDINEAVVDQQGVITQGPKILARRQNGYNGVLISE